MFPTLRRRNAVASKKSLVVCLFYEHLLILSYSDRTRVTVNNIEDRSREYGTERSALVKRITCTMSPIEKYITLNVMICTVIENRLV